MTFLLKIKLVAVLLMIVTTAAILGRTSFQAQALETNIPVFPGVGDPSRTDTNGGDYSQAIGWRQLTKTLLTSLNKAISDADAEVIQIAKLYAADPILQNFQVPRFKLSTVDVNVKYAIASSPDSVHFCAERKKQLLDSLEQFSIQLPFLFPNLFLIVGREFLRPYSTEKYNILLNAFTSFVQPLKTAPHYAALANVAYDTIWNILATELNNRQRFDLLPAVQRELSLNAFPKIVELMRNLIQQISDVGILVTEADLRKVPANLISNANFSFTFDVAPFVSSEKLLTSKTCNVSGTIISYEPKDFNCCTVPRGSNIVCRNGFKCCTTANSIDQCYDPATSTCVEGQILCASPLSTCGNICINQQQGQRCCNGSVCTSDLS